MSLWIPTPAALEAEIRLHPSDVCVVKRCKTPTPVTLKFGIVRNCGHQPRVIHIGLCRAHETQYQFDVACAECDQPALKTEAIRRST